MVFSQSDLSIQKKKMTLITKNGIICLLVNLIKDIFKGFRVHIEAKIIFGKLQYCNMKKN